jgi:hypothetical protein
VSSSYAYVTAEISDSLVVVDIGNPASPVIRGSVVSSSLLDRVRVRRGAATVIELGRRLVALASAPSIMLAPAVRPLTVLSRALTRSLSRAVHTGF